MAESNEFETSTETEPEPENKINLFSSQQFRNNNRTKSNENAVQSFEGVVAESNEFDTETKINLFSSQPLEKPKRNRPSCASSIKDDKMDLIKKFISVPEPASASTDHIDLFFQSIAQSVKVFAPKRISEVKLKIMALVSEMEIQDIDEMQLNSADPLDISILR